MLTGGNLTRLDAVGRERLTDETTHSLVVDVAKISSDIKELFDAIVKLDNAQRERNELLQQELSTVKSELSELSSRRQRR